ncbi:MAG TPA: protein-L-isoaspartate(D-aspartate) O-methyltransferase [Defluviitoga tunisiensis]|jgi:protein-L-isoaspartate(D-aspartate) O-methyltransferase|nr:protein-L-isoaspartate(D-aspartate) O-methyltransferase [Defluviitoga tunisiensis]
MDFELARKRMVHEQLELRGITDRKVLDAFLKVERHLFVPENVKEYAYEDCPLPIGEGQTISQPYMIALMLQHLNLDENDVVLEIGTGSGYQTALLAEIVKFVYSIERSETLAKRAKEILEDLDYKNIKIYVGDGTKGWPEEDISFDKIIVSAGAPDVPEPLFNQLKVGGRMVIPVGSRHYQTLLIVTKMEDLSMKKEFAGGCTFVPLVGEYGWGG